MDKCKLELESTEQTDTAQLWPEKDMLLHQVKDLSPEKSSLETKLRAFKSIIQRLTTNQVQATPVPNTSQLTLGLFGIHGSAKPTPGSAGSRGSLSSHLTFRRMRANEPWMMSLPSFCFGATLQECSPGHWMGQHNRLGRASSATIERRRSSLGHALLPNEYAHRMFHLLPSIQS